MEDLTFKHNGEIIAVVKPTGYVRWMPPHNVPISEELQAAVRLASKQQQERPEKLKSDYFLWGYLSAGIGKGDSNVNRNVVMDFECVGGESEADLMRMADDWLDEYWAEMNVDEGERELKYREERAFYNEAYDHSQD